MKRAIAFFIAKQALTCLRWAALFDAETAYNVRGVIALTYWQLR